MFLPFECCCNMLYITLLPSACNHCIVAVDIANQSLMLQVKLWASLWGRAAMHPGTETSGSDSRCPVHKISTKGLLPRT